VHAGRWWLPAFAHDDSWARSRFRRGFVHPLVFLVVESTYDQRLAVAPSPPPRSRVIDVAAEARALTALPGVSQASLVERVAWLRGCWRAVSGSRTIEEQWMAPSGNSMVGMSRTVRDGQLLEHELVVIREQGERLAYEAQPSGQPKAVFLSTELDDSRVVFENRQHDFPQKISYTLVGGDSLLAAIEGPGRDGPRRVSFPYRRIECADG
jgi:hypothetical protein